MTTALSSFADASGLRLGEVYVETDTTLPRQYGSMISDAQRLSSAVLAILVPSEEHVHSVGGVAVVRHRLEQSTNARLMLMQTADP